MSVWLKALPANAPLSGSEGPLVCVSIQVDACDLESLLESLAKINFPINPEIYHDATVVTVFPDGHEEAVSATLVEFPAWASRVDEVRRALAASGFSADAVQVTSMLDEIHTERPAGHRLKCRSAVH